MWGGKEPTSAWTAYAMEEHIMHKKSAAHPGFKSVQKKIAKQSGVGMKRAGAILAASSREASPQAKAANPRLKRVKG